MAKPIKGTNTSDSLWGTDGDDNIQGKAGNDIVSGGKGNDDIDGGQDIDTVSYAGIYADYVLSYKGTGNDKVTVHDTVAGRDGTDDVKHVEFLQ
jgi:serralysin